jgi:hypothetical protein
MSTSEEGATGGGEGNNNGDKKTEKLETASGELTLLRKQLLIEKLMKEGRIHSVGPKIPGGNSGPSHSSNPIQPLKNMPPPAILSRVKDFLPKMKVANDVLAQKTAADPSYSVSIEDDDKSDTLVEFDLALMLENEEGSSSSDDDGDGDEDVLVEGGPTTATGDEGLELDEEDEEGEEVDEEEGEEVDEEEDEDDLIMDYEPEDATNATNAAAATSVEIKEDGKDVKMETKGDLLLLEKALNNDDDDSVMMADAAGTNNNNENGNNTKKKSLITEMD